MKSVRHHIRIARQVVEDFFRRLAGLTALMEKNGVWILSVGAIIFFPFIIRFIVWSVPYGPSFNVQADKDELESARRKISQEVAALDRKLDAKRPKSYYLVINSASNEFELYRGAQLIKRDKCSTGSYKRKRIYLNGRESLKVYLAGDNVSSGDDPLNIMARPVPRRNVIPAHTELDVGKVYHTHIHSEFHRFFNHFC